jgi:hypothetical protein
MVFFEDIFSYKSLSIIGMAKNTGKTECLNYILRNSKYLNKKLAITSIGIDGESNDVVKNTPKPEIELNSGNIFITTENFYNKRKLTSEILEVSKHSSLSGKLITARCIHSGKIILSGPSDSKNLNEHLLNLRKYNIDLSIIDGAFSRKSHASPALTEALILTTGAAYSSNIDIVVKDTKYWIDLISLDKYVELGADKMREIENGTWILNEQNQLKKTHSSSLHIKDFKEEILKLGTVIYFAGLITENVMKSILSLKISEKFTIIVKDFTRIFTPASLFYEFIAQEGKILTLYKSNLIAVCINPYSPDAYHLNSDVLKSRLTETIQVPVYDIKKDAL